MMVDSGASVDLMDERTFRELYKRKVPEVNKRRISPRDHPHLYLFWELLRPKYSPTPTAHGQPCMSSEVLQETSWVVTLLQNLACSRSSTKSNLTRPVPSTVRSRKPVQWNRQSKRKSRQVSLRP